MEDTHFAELDEEETACIRAVLEDKLNQIKDDPAIPQRAKEVLSRAFKKLSGPEGTKGH